VALPPAARSLPEALGRAAIRRLRGEYHGGGIYRWLARRGAINGLGAAPRDYRPADAEAGRRILAGAFMFSGATVRFGPRGDPWDRSTPGRQFAVALHRFNWIRDLLAAGSEGAAEALRLTLEWRRLFGGWNRFVWSPETLERRVFNLACALPPLMARASEAEQIVLLDSLRLQARTLLDASAGTGRAAEGAAAAAVAGAALSGPAGKALLEAALGRLGPALEEAVGEDGGHASRCPEAALELLFDLRTLDEALSQLGQAAPVAMNRAIARLASAVRFFTLADGRLPTFHGGETLTAAYVAAARAQDEAGDAAPPPGVNGFQRLQGRSLQLIADAAPPAKGRWSETACGQPLAIEVLAQDRRLITNVGWTPRARGPAALRIIDGGSTASLGDAPCGQPLHGFLARTLGPRLVGGAGRIQSERQATDEAVWLEFSHDGYLGRFGLMHERRLYFDLAADELRGEDRFRPEREAMGGAEGRRFIPFVVRFHLAPDVSAMISQDRKSVLLKPEGGEQGWQLRSDAGDIAIEPSSHYEDGEPRRNQQIVLRGQARAGEGGRIRWKLTPASPPVDAGPPAE
jgi:uncharacterized heparinase superfamily protein